MDDAFRDRLRCLYREELPPGGAILDLAASWDSHLPHDVEYASVVAVGINKAELKANAQATAFIAQDLNHDPSLPTVRRPSVPMQVLNILTSRLSCSV